MNKQAQDLRIIFLGTPDFAVASLEALLAAGLKVVAVVTAPDKPAGRGQALQESAVKKCALAHQLPILQPEKLKDPQFLQDLAAYKADLQVVVAFRMLPEVVWNMPAMGTINVHASLLPNYRGAAPIHWAIINGEKETGVSTFQLKHQIDTGNILLQQKVAIETTDNLGTMYQKLMTAGAALLITTIEKLAANEIQAQVQNLDLPSIHAPKITKETGKINWNNTVITNFNLIRGLAPMPGAYTFLDGKMFKIFEAEIDVTPVQENEIGTYQTDQKTYLKFASKDGWIVCKEVQIEGKKRMPIQAFLIGYSFKK